MELMAQLFLWLAFYLADSLGVLSNDPPVIRYSRDFLLQWNIPQINKPPDLALPDLNCYKDLWCGESKATVDCPSRPRKRGKRGGVRVRLRKQSLSRIPLPSIILTNAQSLRNKTDKLQAHVRFQREFRDSCLLAITETWLSDRDSDTDITMDGFGSPVRLDRDAGATGMSRGGGVCLYVNQMYCKNVIVRERLCTKDVELLSVSLRPPYLPREFPQIFVRVVYIHLRANADKASESILQVTQRLQLISPDAPMLIMGDFNHCLMDKTLRDLYQYVTCPTRHNRTLDLC